MVCYSQIVLEDKAMKVRRMGRGQVVVYKVTAAALVTQGAKVVVVVQVAAVRYIVTADKHCSWQRTTPSCWRAASLWPEVEATTHRENVQAVASQAVGLVQKILKQGRE